MTAPDTNVYICSSGISGPEQADRGHWPSARCQISHIEIRALWTRVSKPCFGTSVTHLVISRGCDGS